MAMLSVNITRPVVSCPCPAIAIRTSSAVMISFLFMILFVFEDFFQFRFQFLALQVGGDNLAIWGNEDDGGNAGDAI